jgi:hypothetical protein
MRAVLYIALTMPALAARVPAGTELSVRLTTKVASEAPAGPVSAVVIAPVVLDGVIALPAGAELTGTTKDIKAAADGQRSQIRLDFTRIGIGAYRLPLAAVVASLDNSREKVDDKGVITGIDASKTYSSRIDQGIAKLEANDKYSSLAGLIGGVKKALKIEEANPNIDFDPGVELTVKLTEPLEWRGPMNGPGSDLQPFPNETALIGLVDREPFRTAAANPPRPSDITNIMFLATEEELRAAFDKAGWSSAARLSTKSKLETARALIEDRGYKEGPMSILLLEGQAPDFALQKGNNTFEQRHHLRIFRRPGTFDGKPIWVCSATHDTGIDYSERDHTFIHRIDSSIDRERAKVIEDLLFTGMVRSLALVDRPQIPQDATNATGDRLQTDGRMAVVLLTGGRN